jgi:hypothetical protein
MGAVQDSDSAYDLLGHSTKNQRVAANVSAFDLFDHLIGGREREGGMKIVLQ